MSLYPAPAEKQPPAASSTSASIRVRFRLTVNVVGLAAASLAVLLLPQPERVPRGDQGGGDGDEGLHFGGVLPEVLKQQAPGTYVEIPGPVWRLAKKLRI